MDVDRVIREHERRATDAARVSIACTVCRMRLEACECEFRHERREATRPPAVPPLHGALVTWLEARFSGLAAALARRGVSTTAAAQIVEVERTTLYKWGTGSMQLHRSAGRLSVAQLERMVCLLAPPPCPRPPPIPESMRLRRVADRLQLEMSGAHDCVNDLEAWAKTWNDLVPEDNDPKPAIRISRSLVRLTLEGPESVLRRMRAELLAVERWRTLTPSDDDIAGWIGVGT